MVLVFSPQSFHFIFYFSYEASACFVLVDSYTFGRQTNLLPMAELSAITTAKPISAAPYFPNRVFVLLTVAPPGNLSNRAILVRNLIFTSTVLVKLWNRSGIFISLFPCCSLF